MGELADTITVGKNVTWIRGEARVGNLVYGEHADLQTFKVPSDCSIRQVPNAVNWEEWQHYLQDKSERIRDLPTNGNCRKQYRNLICTGTGYDVDVFMLDEELLDTSSFT
jgi:choice-of-anchor A domain-containing protein